MFCHTVSYHYLTFQNNTYIYAYSSFTANIIKFRIVAMDHIFKEIHIPNEGAAFIRNFTVETVNEW